jgi:glycosyltransferase involved in cell wall biosynthesis
MRSLRILIVTFSFPPNKDGISENARAMAENFASHGHSVTVATGYSSERKSDFHHGIIEVRQFRVAGSPNLRDGIRGEVKAFKEFISGFKGDVIIVHCWHIWASSLAEEAFPQGDTTKRIMMSHGFSAHLWVPQHRFPWGLGQWLGFLPWTLMFPWRLRKYDCLVLTSPRADLGRFFDHLVAKLTFYRKVTVIPNGTDPEKFEGASDAFRQRFGLAGKCVVLNVANFCERKNQEFALRAFARANLENSILVFIGSEFNSYSDRVRRLANELGLSADRVLLIEGLSRELTYSAFQHCDMVVLSARAETQPIVLLEAMVCGKPFITTKTGAVGDFPGGFIVRDESAMAERLQQLAGDKVLRQQLGAEGRKAALEKYTWSRVGERWEELVARVISA